MNSPKHLSWMLLVSLFIGLGAQTIRAERILLLSWSNSPDPLEDMHIRENMHVDEPLITFLESLGHVVDTSGMGSKFGANPFTNPTQSAALNSADLILFSNVLKSGLYANERVEWNALEKPVLSLMGWLTRGGTAGGLSRFGWINERTFPNTNTANTSDPAEIMQIAAGQESHPFVEGLQPSTQLWDWSDMPGGVSPWAPRTVDDGSHVVPGGVVVGTLDGRPMLIDYPKGTNFDEPDEFGSPQNGPPRGNANLHYGTAGARRSFLSDWGYHCTNDACPLGTYDYADGRTPAFNNLLAQVIDEMLARPNGLLNGDIDFDGDVDGDDLTKWQSNFGINGNGDADGDGDTDGADFLAWQQRLGSGVTTLLGSSQTVPEPSSGLLILIALLATIRRRVPWQTSAFSVLPRSKSSTCLCPSLVMPIATMASSSLLKRMPSSITATQSCSASDSPRN